MRKIWLLLTTIALGMIWSAFFIIDQKEVTVEMNQYDEAQVDDFILHTRVEQVSDGIKVYSSLQYVGSDAVRVESTIPLIFATLNETENPFIDQSEEDKHFEKGSIYHPEEMVVFSTPEKGIHDLHIQAHFFVEHTEVSIQIEKELRVK